jgi:hypothetical protein
MMAARLTLGLLLVPALAGPVRCADTPAKTADQGPFLGVLFSPVPEVQFARSCQRLTRPFLGFLALLVEVLLERTPSLPGARGVVVTQVMPDSPAEKSGLKRGDILLRYNDTPIGGCRDFVELIRGDKENNKVNLLLRRDRRETKVEVTLALGPALRLAPAYSSTKKDSSDGPKAIAKPLPPSSVRVAVGPLADGKMKVIVEYYQQGTGKLCTVTCVGNSAEIDTELKRLPERERDVVRRALDRLTKSATKPEKPATNR